MRHHPVRVGARATSCRRRRSTPIRRRRCCSGATTTSSKRPSRQLRTGAGRAALRQQLAATRNAAQVLKLFQPMQRQFHLALVEAWCDTAGTPRIDPARVDSAGLVLRRMRNDASGRYLEGWVKGAGRLRGWARVRQRAERARTARRTAAGAALR